MNLIRDSRTEIKRSQVIGIKFVALLFVSLLASAAALATDPPQILPKAFTVCSGGQVNLTVSGDSAATATWTVDNDKKGSFDHTSGSATTTFTATSDQIVLKNGKVKDNVAIVTATIGGTPLNSRITIEGPSCNSGGEIVRAVVGFEQVGASATPSAQSFMFDFFISRPVPIPHFPGEDTWGSRLRWWGDIKVSSYPDTQKSSIATVAQQFSTVFGNQNFNQFAESIDFVTGPELRLFTSGSRGSLTDQNSAARFGLTWFAGVGATGPNNPADNATVFLSPAAGSSQAMAILALPGNPTFTPCPAPATPPTPCTNYVAFVPESADRFLQQWGSGLRLYTLFTNKPGGDVSFAAPATIEFSIGQNASVTESHMHNFVLHIGGMYPFSIGSRGASGSVVIYLFGEVNTALERNTVQDTLILSPALDTSGNPISVSSPGVTQIPVQANRRDTYRLGVGVDLISVWQKITAAKPANAAKPGSE